MDLSKKNINERLQWLNSAKDYSAKGFYFKSLMYYKLLSMGEIKGCYEYNINYCLDRIKPRGRIRIGRDKLIYYSGLICKSILLQDKRPFLKILVRTAIRNECTEILDVLALLSSNGMYRSEELVSELLKSKKIIDEIDKDALQEFLLLKYLINYSRESEWDCYSILKILIHNGNIAILNREALRSFFQMCIINGDKKTAVKILEAEALTISEKKYMLLDTIDPVNDTRNWLKNFNKITSGYLNVKLNIEKNNTYKCEPFDCLHGDVGLRKAFGPLVTVIVSSYKPNNQLVTSVKSLINQTWSNIQIIIVDDCSGEDYDSFYEKCRALDSSILVIKQESNMGTYEARNKALKFSKGEYVTFQDSDDWAHPQKIELQAAPLIKTKKYVCTLSKCIRTSDSLRLTYKGYAYGPQDNASSLMFRRELVVSKLGKYISARKGADSEYISRIEKYFGSGSILRIDKILSFVRLSPHSLSRAEFRYGWRHFNRTLFRSGYEKWHSDSHENPGELNLNNVCPQKFYIPLSFAVNRTMEKHDKFYDFLYILDMTLNSQLIGEACEEIRKILSFNKSVAIFQLYSIDNLSYNAVLIDERVQLLLNTGRIDIVDSSDSINCDMCIIRQPEIFNLNVGREININSITSYLVLENDTDYASNKKYVLTSIQENLQKFGLPEVKFINSNEFKMMLIDSVDVAKA